ncbi:MAG: DUF3341 domain-containing protein [Janthinobacterium lividum]
MTPGPPHRGLLAEFTSSDALVAAIHAARGAGYRRLDAFTPFPVDAAGAALGFDEHRLGPIAAAGGAFGFFGMMAVQVTVNLRYPINVGGRPLLAWPAFLVTDVEMLMLFATIFAVVAMLWLNRLPRLNHPVFDSARFRLASDDRFFLLIGDDDPRFGDARGFLAGLDPFTVTST